MVGRLWLVPTPIGNLDDITLRAVKVLRSASYVLAERRAAALRLFARYGVRAPVVVYREDNHSRVAPKVLEDLRKGAQVALISEAGAPGVSDPGARLVQEVYDTFKDATQRIVVLPGPNAVITALTGFPVRGEFLFIGFLPRDFKDSIFSDEEFWLWWLNHRVPVVFFEAPHRLLDTLESLLQLQKNVMHNKKVNLWVGVAKELTKVHEQRFWGPLSQIYIQLKNTEIKGEFTLVVVPKEV